MADAMILAEAVASDAEALAALHTSVGEDLARRFAGRKSPAAVTGKSVLFTMTRAKVYVARHGDEIVATLALSTRKPWAIDIAYFSPARRPLYLTHMAVAPGCQGEGIGARCVEAALEIASAWPADAIRLDAYDAPWGAGTFYAKCGFREAGRVVYRNTPLIYFERLLPLESSLLDGRSTRKARRRTA